MIIVAAACPLGMTIRVFGWANMVKVLEYYRYDTPRQMRVLEIAKTKVGSIPYNLLRDIMRDSMDHAERHIAGISPTTVVWTLFGSIV